MGNCFPPCAPCAPCAPQDVEAVEATCSVLPYHRSETVITYNKLRNKYMEEYKSWCMDMDVDFLNVTMYYATDIQGCQVSESFIQDFSDFNMVLEKFEYPKLL